MWSVDSRNKRNDTATEQSRPHLYHKSTSYHSELENRKLLFIGVWLFAEVSQANANSLTPFVGYFRRGEHGKRAERVLVYIQVNNLEGRHFEETKEGHLLQAITQQDNCADICVRVVA